MVNLTSRKIKGSSSLGIIYLYGNEYIDGSRRLARDIDTDFMEIQERIEGIWQPASFETGPNSLWVGKNVGVAGVGHHLATESSDGHLHFHAHSSFEGGLSIKDTQIINAYQYTERAVLQVDDTGTWTGKLWESSSMAYANTVSNKIYFKTNTLAASDSIRFQVWEGSDDTGILIFDQSYPAIDFPASTEVKLDLNGYLEYSAGTNYFNRISSDEDFSLKTNSEATSIWFAVDLSLIREEHLLQTKEWVSGDTWTQGDYFINDRTIYVCNTTGIQTGTFVSNSDKWGILCHAQTISGLTEGSIPFGASDSSLAQDNDNLFYDDTLARLKLGKALVTENNLISKQESGLYFGRTRISESNWNSTPVINKWIIKDSTRSWFDVAASDDTQYQIASVDGGKLYTSSNYGEIWIGRDSDRAWKKVAISSTGQYQSSVVYGGQIYISSDYGVTWTAKENTRNWLSVGMSNDGKYQTAGIHEGDIYISSDYGNTFSVVSKSGSIRAIAISSTGQYQVVGSSGQGVYVSSDYGATFSHGSGTTIWGWRGVDISDNGKYMVACSVEPNGRIYRSIDYGANWTDEGDGVGRDYIDVSMSSDGKYQTVVVDDGKIYVSVWYGANWTVNDSISRAWRGIVLSNDATIQIGVVDSGYIYIQQSNFMNMTQRIGSASWRAVDISSDGKYQTIVGDGSAIRVSSDYGITWIEAESSRSWFGIAISSDGKYQTATAQYNDIYRSTDYGITWTGVSAGNLSWSNVAMSSDGLFQVAVIGGQGSSGYIYTSFNYGATWSQKASEKYWQKVACSSDGKYITATEYAKIWYSSDYGETWTSTGSSNVYKGVAMSSDGKYQSVTSESSTKKVYVSSNYGVSWSQKGIAGAAYCVSMSSDGKYQMFGLDAYDIGTNFYISDDYGQIWTILYGTRKGSWTDVKMSSDGKYIIAANNSDGIYTYCFDSIMKNDVNIEGSLEVIEEITKNNVIVPSQNEIYNYTTGWLDGGQISINSGDNTKIDITSGSVLITDYTDQLNPTITKISWSTQTSLDPGLTTRSKWIGVKDDGDGNAEFVYDTQFDAIERRSNAILARIWDNAGTGPQITNVGDYERPAWQLTTAFQDFILEYGSWNISGNKYSANGANLTLDKSAGTSFRYNSQNIPGYENVHVDDAQTPRTSYAYHLQGLSVVTSEADIDPDYYDNSGVKEVVPANKWTIQEIWFFPVSGTCHVLYGQDYYNSKGDALLSLSTEDKVRNEEILNGSIKRAYLIIQQGCTELNDLDTAEIREKNGMTGSGSPYWERDDGILTPSEAGDSLNIDGDIVSDKIYLQGSGTDYIDWNSVDNRFRFSNGIDMSGYELWAQAVTISGNLGCATIDASDYIDTPQIKNPDGILTIEGITVDGGTVNATTVVTNGGESDEWNEAYSWGDHSLVGYLTSESDPIFSAWDKSTGISITESQISDLDHFTTEDETDPVFGAWDKNSGISITESQISDLSHTPAFDGDIAEIFNSEGDLKIQPDVTGNVVLFGDTDVANDENGKILYIRRQAPEGNDYIRFYVSSGRVAYIHANNKLTLQAQQPFTINSVTDSINFKVGDNAGAEKVYFKDSDGAIVAKLDSNGWLWIDANMGGGWQVNRGSNNNIETFMDSTYTDLRFGGAKEENRIGTWINKDFRIVTNSLPRVTIDNNGKVGIGKTPENYALEILAQDPVIQLENSRTIMGVGYNVGGLIFSAGELSHENVGLIRVDAAADWTDTSSPTRMTFFTTSVNATSAVERMRIDQYGRVEIPSSLTVGDLEATDDILAYGDVAARNLVSRGALVFQDKSTQEEAGERHFSQGHLNTAVYSGNWYDASSENMSERDLHFSPDGLSMYIIGIASSGAGDCSIWEYELTTPWDLSTLGSPTIESIETYGSNQVGLFISTDGRRLWTVCTSNDTVIEYSMSPWNISSLTWVQAKDISGQDTTPSAIFWSANGDRLFVAGDADNDIVAFSVTNEWDISGISWFEDFGTDIDAPTGLYFSSDGRRMYVMDGSAEDDIHEFHLSSPWKISSAILVNQFNVSTENTSPQGIFLTPDNSKIFMIGTSTPDGIYGYDLGLEANGTIISNNGPIQVGSMTTTQRNAMIAVNGMIIYNTTINSFNFYENGSWITKT